MSLVNLAYVLELDPDEVRELYAAGGIHVDGDPLPSLAQAVATSPAVPSVGESILVVRPGTRGALAAIGRFEQEDRPRLEALSWQLDLALRRLKYVDHRAALTACQQLAVALEQRLGPDVLGEARFAPVPRGGLIVLGMLAYQLDLSAAQIGVGDAARVTVHVDDCAISGLRAREILERSDGPVVFAHLFSHPDLRAILEADERVEACVAGGDLVDHAPTHYGTEYEAWRQRWHERRGDRLFWVGQPDHVCFPWNEPDVGIWNPLRGREEPGWRIVPPSHCMKNRRRSGATHMTVRIQPACAGPLRAADDVVFGRLSDGVVVARADHREAVSLSDVAGDVWDGLVRHGAIGPVVQDIARAYSGDRKDVAKDVRALVSDLAGQGLLVEAPLDPLQDPPHEQGRPLDDT